MTKRFRDKQDNRGFEPTIRLRIEPTMLANWSPEQTGTATVSAADLRATIEEYTRRFREAWVRLA